MALRRADLVETVPAARRYLDELKTRDLIAFPERQNDLSIEKLAKLPFTVGNDVELLVDGKATFDSIFEGIQRAEDYILVQFYILRADGLGSQLKDRLADKARQGVRVYVLYDEVGSNDLPDTYLSAMTAAGIQAHKFNTTKGRANRFPDQFSQPSQDRRGRRTGGLGRRSQCRRRVSGKRPDVRTLARHPYEGVRAGGASDPIDLCRGLALGQRRDAGSRMAARTMRIRTIRGRPGTALRTGRHTGNLHPVFYQGHSERRTPPVDRQPLLRARRAVHYRLAIGRTQGGGRAPDDSAQDRQHAGQPDPLGLYNAAAAIGGSRCTGMRKASCTKRSSWSTTTMHTVGTANFDNRSFRLNFEITVVVADNQFNSEVARMLEADFTCSRLVSAADIRAKGPLFRFAVRAAQLTAPIQ